METRIQKDAESRSLLLTVARELLVEETDFSLQTLLARTGVSADDFHRCFADKEQLLAALTGEDVRALDQILDVAQPDAMRAAVGSDITLSPTPQTDAWLERRLRVFERALTGLEKRQEKSEQNLSLQLAQIGETLAELAAAPAPVTRMEEAPEPEKLATDTAPEEEALLERSVPELGKPALLVDALAPEQIPAPVSEQDVNDFIAHARRVAQNAAIEAQAAPPQRLTNMRWLAWSGAVLLTLMFCAGMLFASGALGRSAPMRAPIPVIANSGVSHRQVAQTSLTRVIALADSGDAAAQTMLALDYLRGQGVAGDDAAAKRWSLAAASQGQPVAEYLLGTLYLEGDKDEREAARWFLAAAVQGNVKAMHNLAIAFDQGLGVEKDPAEAVKWFVRAAQEGYRDSEFDLGVLYERGEGVPQSARAALKWYLIAANQGDAPSAARADMLKQQIDPMIAKAAAQEAASFVPQPVGTSANQTPVL